jgi:hypothetical protein
MYLEARFWPRSGTLAAVTMPYLYLADPEDGVKCTCRRRSPLPPHGAAVGHKGAVWARFSYLSARPRRIQLNRPEIAGGSIP